MEDNKIKLYAKLNVIRLELSKGLSKSGKNDYAKFKYFQLDDFIPQIIEMCNRDGIFTKFYIDKEKVELPFKEETLYGDNGNAITSNKYANFEYREYGYLEVTDLDTGYTEMFKKETKDATVSGASAIQNLGAKSTYMKRYMYMDLFEINENDAVDGDTRQETKAAPRTTTPKAVVKSVETTPVAPVEMPKEEVKPISTNSTDELSKASKQELVNLIKGKGLEPKATLESLCNEIGKTLTSLLESDKEVLIEKLNKIGE